MKEKHEVVIGLGSNIGDRKQNLELAIAEMEKVFECTAKCSRFYQSEAWGFDTNDLFLNCCIIITTHFSPKEVLNETQSIELKLGRVKKSKNNVYESRVIDLDILYFGNLILETETLIIPHPLIYDRAFVVRPLADVRPLYIDPVKRVSILDILAACNDETKVLLYED